MSIKVMTMVFDRYPVGGNERLLALAMADHARDDGTRIWPSIADLARKTLQSESTVRRQIKHMVARGWLEPVRKASGRPGDTNEYRIHPGWIGGAALPLMGDEPGGQGGLPAEGTGVNLTPVPETPNCEQDVCKSDKNVDKVIHTGVKPGGTGVTAMTPESSNRTINTNTPPSPRCHGGRLKNKQTENPENPKADKPEWRWHQSRSGIERQGHRLGVGGWDEAAFQAGRGEAFAAYERRVLQAWEVERAARLARAQAAGGRQGSWA